MHPGGNQVVDGLHARAGGGFPAFCTKPRLDSEAGDLDRGAAPPPSRGGRFGKTFTTNDSPVVPHLSTELAQRCLVSQIGRDATRSPRYERMMASARLDPPGPPQAGRHAGRACWAGMLGGHAGWAPGAGRYFPPSTPRRDFPPSTLSSASTRGR